MDSVHNFKCPKCPKWPRRPVKVVVQIGRCNSYLDLGHNLVVGWEVAAQCSPLLLLPPTWSWSRRATYTVTAAAKRIHNVHHYSPCHHFWKFSCIQSVCVCVYMYTQCMHRGGSTMLTITPPATNQIKVLSYRYTSCKRMTPVILSNFSWHWNGLGFLDLTLASFGPCLDKLSFFTHFHWSLLCTVGHITVSYALSTPSICTSKCVIFSSNKVLSSFTW